MVGVGEGVGVVVVGELDGVVVALGDGDDAPPPPQAAAITSSIAAAAESAQARSRLPFTVRLLKPRDDPLAF
jgi:hypothetical protein